MLCFYGKNNRMKTRVVVIALSLALPLMARAQTEKGRWLVGTQFGSLTYQKQESGYRNIAGNISPLASYFVANGLAIGTGIPFSFNAVKYGTTDANFYNLRQNANAIGLAPFVRYYIGPAKLKPFVGIAYSYSHTTGKYKTDTAGGSESKTSGHTTALIPTIGLAYFVTRTLGLSLNINYNANHVEYSTVQTSTSTPGPSSADYDTRSLSLGIGFQIFVGK